MKKNKKYYFEFIFYFLLIFFISRFFNFEIFGKYPILKNIYKYCSQIFFLVITFCWIRKNSITRKDIKIMGLIIIYIFSMLISTIINNGDIRNIIMISYPLLGIVMLISIALKRNIFIFFKSYAYLFYILVLINLLDSVLFKDLSSQYSTSYFFIGGKNQLAIAFSVGLCFINIYLKGNKNFRARFMLYSYILIIIISSILSKSGTCIISILILILLNNFKILNKFLTPINFCIEYFIFSVGIIYFRIQYYFSFIICDILHKDLTFTHRTDIWEKAIKEILMKPFFGYGTHDNTNYFKILVQFPTEKIFKSYSAHNQIIQNLYEYGFIGLFIFILIYCVCTGFKVKKNRIFDYFFNTIIVIFITWFAEAPGIYAMFVMLILCYYSKDIKTHIMYDKKLVNLKSY